MAEPAVGAKLRCLYDFAGDPSIGTPAVIKDEELTLVQKHDSGWYEIVTPRGTTGYISPAWVVAADLNNTAKTEGNGAEQEWSQADPPFPGSLRGSIGPADDPGNAQVSGDSQSAVTAEDVSRRPARASLAPVPPRRVSSQLGAAGEKGPPPPVAKRKQSKVATVSQDFMGDLANKIGTAQPADPPAPDDKDKKPPPPVRAKSALLSGPSVVPPANPPTPPPQRAKPAVVYDLPAFPSTAAASDGGGEAAVPGRPEFGTPFPKPGEFAPRFDPGGLPPPPPELAEEGGGGTPPDQPPPGQLTPPIGQGGPATGGSGGGGMSGLTRRNSYKPYEGPVERKAMLEGGHEAKSKKWEKCYAALAGPTLYFFKDEKSKKAGKKPIGFMKMKGKVFVDEPDVPKKKFTFSLGDSVEKYLFSAPSEALKVEWSSRFSSKSVARASTVSAGADIVEEPAEEAPAQADEPDEPEPAVSVAVTEEDAARCAEIRCTLARYMAARPGPSEVAALGEVTGSVFGGHVTEQVVREGVTHPHAAYPGVPTVVVRCVAYVDQHLAEKGIYRVSGTRDFIQALKKQCDTDVFTAEIDSATELHTVTGLLKLYFRELADPLFTDAMYEQFMTAAREAEVAVRNAEIRRLVHLLPTAHQATLEFMCRHLLRVTQHEATNMMGPQNVAIVFGPTLLRCSTSTPEAILRDSSYQSSVIEQILSNLDWFLADAL